MERREGRKPADTGRAVEPAMRIVLLAMECSRLRGLVDQLLNEREKQTSSLQENELLRNRVAVLEASMASKSKFNETRGPLASELATLRTEVQRKDQELRRLYTEKQVADLSIDGFQAKAAHIDSQASKIEELRNENSKLCKEVLELKLQVDEVMRLKRENSNLHRQLDEIAGEKRDYRVDTELLRDFTARVSSLETDNNHLRSRLQEMLDRENDHIHRQETIATLESRLRSLLQEHEDTKTNLTKLNADNSKLASVNEKLPQYEESIRKLIAENDRVTTVLSEMKVKNQADASTELLKANQTLKLQGDSLRLELDRTKNDLKESQERIKSLSLHCSTKTAEASQLEVVLAENSRLANMLADLKRQNSGLLKDRDEFKGKLSITEENLKQIQNSFKEKVNSLEELLQSANHTIKKQEISLENLEKTNNTLGNKNTQLLAAEDTIRRLTGEHESMKRINSDLNQFNASLTEQLGLVKQELATKIGIEDSYKSALQELNYLTSSRDTLDLKLKSTTHQLSSVQSELDALHIEMKKLIDSSKQTTNLKAETDKYRGLYLEAEDKLKIVSELENKISILQSQNRGLFDTNSELRKALLAKEPIKPQAEVSMTLEESYRLKSMIQELELELSLLREKEVNLKSQLNVASGKLRTLETLESESNVLRIDNLNLKTQKEDLNQEVKRLRAELAKDRENKGIVFEDFEDKRILRMELESIRLRLADAEGRLGQSEVEKLRMTTELRSKVAELTSQNEVLQDALNEEQLAFGRQKHDLEELRDKVMLLEKLSSQHERTRAELNEKESSLNEYRRKLELLDSEKNTSGQRFEARIHEAHGERERQLFREATLNREVEELNKKLQKLKEENLQLKGNEAKRRLLEDEVERLQATMQDSKEKLAGYHSRTGNLNELELKIKISEEDNSALRKRIAEMVALMDEMRSLNLDLEMKNRAIPSMQSQVGLLQEQIQDKDNLIQELTNQLSSLERSTKNKIDTERGNERLMTGKMGELEAANARLSREQQNLRLEVESLRLENHRLKSELSASEDLLVEIKRQSKENHSLITDHHQLQSQKEQLAMRVSKLELEAGLYKEKLSEALVELERVPILEIDNRRKVQEIADLQCRVDELMKLNDQMRSRMTERDNDMDAAIAKTEKNRQALTEVSLNHLQAEIKALENDRNGWKTHTQKLEKALGQQEQEAQRKAQLISAEKSALAKQLQDAKQTRHDHENEIKHLLDEIDGYRKKVDLLEFKLRESYAKLDHYEELVDQSQLQASIAAAKMGNSENALARDNKRLSENLQRTNDELHKIKSLAERQAEDLRNKSADIVALRQKLACCASEFEKIAI